MIKRLPAAVLLWSAAVLLAAPAVQPAGAASFTPRRGINLDAWTTWPAEARWGDPAVLFPFPEWRRGIGDEELARLKTAGFDFVRIPVDPAPFLSPVAAPFRERLLAEVLAAARFVNKQGLKALVDLHLMPAGPEARAPGMSEVMADPALFEAYVELVTKIAERLGNEDAELVALEPMNEPIADCEGTKTWPERQKRLWAAARAGAPKLTLVLAGGCYGSAESLAAVEPADYSDSNILWTFHSYEPFLLTHQGATWTGDFAPFVSGLPFPLWAVPQEELEARIEAVRARIGSEAPWARRGALIRYLDEQIGEIDTPEKLDRVMEKPFAIVARWASENGVAPENILLGEFGMIRQEYGSPFVMPGAWRAAYVEDTIGHAEKHGFAWSLWSYGGAFGIVEGFDGEKAGPEVLDAVRALPPFPHFTLRPETD